MAFSYRLASLDDVDSLAELRAASGWTEGAGAETMRRYLKGKHHPQQALAPRAMFVAENGRDVTGFVAGHSTTRFGCTGELQWLLVAPTQRGKGVASALIAALAKWFVEKRATRVCVNVAPDNAAARQLYARLGAAELSEHWMVWEDIAAVRGPAERRAQSC